MIYAVLVVMWAAYFIPRWLRRHEELSEARSVERFSRAMRILSRREPTPDRRYVVMPPRPADPPPLAARRRRPSRPASAATASRVPGPRHDGRRTYVSPTARRMALRRRRVLALLLLTFITVAVATPLSPLPWWAPLLALAAVVGWLVHCRLQARTRTVVSRTRQAARTRSRSRLMRFDALDRLMAVRRELAEERAAEEARWQQAERAMRREREAEEARERGAADGWTPVPVPLPTYVTKPAAPRPAQPIDLTNPGAWTAAQAATADTPPTRESTPHGSALSALLDDAAEADDQLDAIIQRRAVND